MRHAPTANMNTASTASTATDVNSTWGTATAANVDTTTAADMSSAAPTTNVSSAATSAPVATTGVKGTRRKGQTASSRDGKFEMSHDFFPPNIVYPQIIVSADDVFLFELHQIGRNSCTNSFWFGRMLHDSQFGPIGQFQARNLMIHCLKGHGMWVDERVVRRAGSGLSICRDTCRF